VTTDDETVRVWLVERTYSDDDQNIIILVYATPDGERYYRKDGRSRRSRTSGTRPRRSTSTPTTSGRSNRATASATPPRPGGWPPSTTPTRLSEPSPRCAPNCPDEVVRGSSDQAERDGGGS